MLRKILGVAIAGLVLGISVAKADVDVSVNFTAATGTGAALGKITLRDTPYGLLLIPNLSGLIPGLHGFHIHEKPSCANNGTDAGGHLDPNKTGKHLGPYDSHGHLGDLPGLYVDAHGLAVTPVLAPRLTVAKVLKHSLMIHENGDNYADLPAPLGGGGPRMACGVINAH